VKHWAREWGVSEFAAIGRCWRMGKQVKTIDPVPRSTMYVYACGREWRV
jgi:hypothetical protein